MIVIALALMATGMLLSAWVSSLWQLAMCRLFTGLGVGAVMGALSSLACELSNERYRDRAVSLVNAGYSAGALLGAAVAAWLLQHYEWRSLFLVGGILSALFIPLILWLVPESIHFLVSRRPTNALGRINQILTKLGHESIDSLPACTPTHSKSRISRLFAPGLRCTTVLLTWSYFMQVMLFYYLMGWLPTMVAERGFSPAIGSSVSMAASLGGLAGSIILAWLASRVSIRRLTISTMIIGGVTVGIFGLVPSHLQLLFSVAALTGFFVHATTPLFYALMTRAFAVEERATGVGFVIGICRGGAVLSPIAAGFMFDAGLSIAFVSMLIGCSGIVAASILVFTRTPMQPTTSRAARA